MKKILFLLITCLFFVPVKGEIDKKEATQNLLKQKITSHNYLSREIPLEDKSALKISKHNTDKNGIEHVKYSQEIEGVPIDNLTLILHKKGNELKYTGQILSDLNLDTNPTLSEQATLPFALASMHIKIPSWENEAYENLLKKVKNDPEATNYPKGQLVIYDNNYSQIAANYRLAYKFQIFSIEPLSNKIVYVDAHTGIILESIENIHNCNESCTITQATGTTNYHGTVNFEACSEDGIYQLDYEKEETSCEEKCVDITVFDTKNRTDFPQNCIESADDSFEEDPTTNEVYWAMHRYYDYLLNNFNRKSIDGEDHALIAYVHHGKDYVNAKWAGYYAFFGDGDGQSFDALTSIDIVAHEFTHGLIEQTANLIYKDESGALNESFADIFGILLEHSIGEKDWQIGNQFTLQDASLRNFVNPKDTEQFYGSKPSTYKGEYWYEGDWDNGGVHTNSSVQNHWFYLLSEGGSGTNDHGDDYDINGIGIDKAAEIVYSNLTNYLTETSNFMDAREGAVEAAKAIFGEGSDEVEQTKLAWCAVGVGECIGEEDLPSTCNREADSLALVALYNSTDGVNWTNPWDLRLSMNNWYGVTLNQEGCVTCLDLDGNNNCGNSNGGGNNLIGTIPPELGNLKNLQKLILIHNQLTGSIPAELGNLSTLTQLYLDNNELSGMIPAELGNLSKLTILSLYNNKLSGSIPAELGNLSKLTRLLLYTNQLTGSIPVTIGDLSNLTNLLLSSNQLSGNIPPEIGKLSKLTTLSLYNNELSGSIPSELGSLSNLKQLLLSSNQIIGSIPAELGNLSSLVELDLHLNQISGNIPAKLGNLSKLEILELDNNQIAGNIPDELCNLSNLTKFEINNNNLQGCYPDCMSIFCNQLTSPDFEGNADISDHNNFDASWEDFCASEEGTCIPPICDPQKDKNALIALYNSTDGANWTNTWDLSQPMNTWYGVTLNEEGCVTCLDLDGEDNCIWNNSEGNNLIGAIPPELGNLNNLQRLILSNNQISGSIPAELGDLSNLTHLCLDNNQLNGNIPSDLGFLLNLTDLKLENNQLNGIIPAELGNLNKLTSLYLHTNQLIGSIPTELGNLSQLINLWLTENQLTGNIPTELGNLGMLTDLRLSRNQLTGGIPAELGNLNNLILLYLYNNQLSGNIPPEIGTLDKLTHFGLYNNNLGGSIPAELGELSSLISLLIYNNQFTGNIPSELCKLTNLTLLEINDNNFQGCYPDCMNTFCGQLNHTNFNGNDDISSGNNFDTNWEDFCATGTGQCECNDREVLLEVYTSLGGSTSNLNWDLSASMNTWRGVGLNEFDCVESLWLAGENLNGIIPSSIGNLKNLKNLDLQRNNLSGEIPNEIYNLLNLNSLVLNGNQLNGSISPLLANLIQLDFLNLSDNQLTGTIPVEIGMLKNLTQFWCNSNNLSGEIPVEISNCSLLEKLSLVESNLSGEIPDEIGNLVKLKYLDIQRNQISGTIPSSIGNLVELETLSLHNNNLSGCFPNSLNELCEQLDEVNIDNGNNLDATWEEFCETEAGKCEETIVLPGDFNNDSCLSYTDVLIWGLAEGNTGPTRENASNDFVPQMAEDWQGEVNGVNNKHQDANGDGVVDISDLIVFVNNFEIDSTRCNGGLSNTNREFTDHILIQQAGIVDTGDELEVKYEIFVDSKLDNVGLSLHGFEFALDITGYDEILDVVLDTSPFNAEVETVDTLIKHTGSHEYKAAITKTNNGNSKFSRDTPAAILIVIIEDLPNGLAKQIQIQPSGSYITASAGVIPLPLQGTNVYNVTDNGVTASVNIVPPTSTTKGSVEVFILNDNGIENYSLDNSFGPGGVPIGNSFNLQAGPHNITISENDVEIITDLPPPPPPSLPLHPNPATDIVYFDLQAEDLCKQKIQTIEIFDVTGYLVQTVQPNKQGECYYNIDVSDLSTGIYFINILSGDRISNGKFMKQ